MLDIIKKNFWFSFFCLIVACIFFALGTWQIKRLAWKENLIRQVEENSSLPALELSSINAENIPPLYGKVTGIGYFLNENELLVLSKYRGKKLGFQLITPLRLENDTIVLVNRGWIPDSKRDKSKRPETIENDLVFIEGLFVDTSRKAAWFLPQNKPEKNFWFWENAEQMSEFLKNEKGLGLIPLIIHKTNKSNSEFPIIMENNTKISNDHLEYAVTWFSLVIVVLVMYVFYIRSKKKFRG